MNNPIVTRQGGKLRVLELAKKINTLFSRNGWDTFDEIAITAGVGCVEIQMLLSVGPNSCSSALNTLHAAGIPFIGTWEDLHAGGMINVPLSIA